MDSIKKINCTTLLGPYNMLNKAGLEQLRALSMTLCSSLTMKFPKCPHTRDLEGQLHMLQGFSVW